MSHTVRQQYEEHPYPKWVRLPADIGGASGHAKDRARSPLTAGRSSDQERQLDILVAGCGTGQESIEIAQQFPCARVLAVDLSLASLGYAERKTRELHVHNVEHVQGDILEMGTLERTFDLIYSVGVLHHLSDPVRGLRTLASMLTPGGHMLVGLYSERSRQDVVAARSFIAERGYVANESEIRRCRQELMDAHHVARFSRLASRADFYVTSECRDLLFHVHERRFTLREVRELLDAVGLRFNGFQLSAPMAAHYDGRYRRGTGLDGPEEWEGFEEEFPDAFAGMYIFWAQTAR